MPVVGDTITIRFTIQERNSDDELVAVDISGASIFKALVKDPAGTTSAETCTLTTDGTDGKFEFTFAVTATTIPGRYELMPQYQYGAGGYRYTGKRVTLDLDPIIEVT